jgi:hypothetical protein
LGLSEISTLNTAAEELPGRPRDAVRLPLGSTTWRPCAAVWASPRPGGSGGLAAGDHHGQRLRVGQPHEQVPRHHRGEDQRVHPPPLPGLRIEDQPHRGEVDLALTPGSPSATRTVVVFTPNPHRSTPNRCSVRCGTTARRPRARSRAPRADPAVCLGAGDRWPLGARHLAVDLPGRHECGQPRPTGPAVLDPWRTSGPLDRPAAGLC